ncbi:nucleoside recognition domain-containing protein [Halonatronum saccharophilum]|uniref:nucleoside recognition domain-containing protein n=1 Tax=Halonatronum saccharophilum TaxID=150060 RepID=UPI0004834CFD|nr:nucleoside recognition domain-containing protein [Halonatronum saccharophilum]
MINAIKRGGRKAFFTYLELVKIIIPVYIVVTFLKYTGVINYLAGFFSPLMRIVGLPGEAVLALLTGYLLNIYGAIAVIVGLDLGLKEVTILGAMLGLAHSLIIEGAVMKKMRVKVVPLTILRLAASLFAGVLLNLIL